MNSFLSTILENIQYAIQLGKRSIVYRYNDLFPSAIDCALAVRSLGYPCAIVTVMNIHDERLWIYGVMVLVNNKVAS